jgi:hypothetical protein
VGLKRKKKEKYEFGSLHSAVSCSLFVRHLNRLSIFFYFFKTVSFEFIYFLSTFNRLMKSKRDGCTHKAWEDPIPKNTLKYNFCTIFPNSIKMPYMRSHL